MILVFYFKSKQNTFVQSNTTQVYLLSLNALTCMLHVSAVYKTREYKKGTSYIIVSSCIYSCVDIPIYCVGIGQNVGRVVLEI